MRPTFECFQVGQFKTIQCWRGHSCGTSTFYLPPIAKVIFGIEISTCLICCASRMLMERNMKERGEEIAADALLLPHHRLGSPDSFSSSTISCWNSNSFFFMNIVLQDLCTSGHWDCGSRWLASTWKEKQRKAKIGKTPGTTNQVSCCKFQWLPSVWQMWGDSQLSIYGRSCWEIQTKGRRTCTSKVNISTFCKRGF